MKTCKTCQQEKPLADFYPSTENRDGHTSRCKACVRAATKDRRDRKGLVPVTAVLNTRLRKLALKASADQGMKLSPWIGALIEHALASGWVVKQTSTVSHPKK